MLTMKIEDRRGLYHTVTSGPVSRAGMRENLSALGFILGRQTRALVERELPAAGRVLCVVILRGGALLYPGFLAAFPEADFCMLGLQRTEDGVARCSYCSHVEGASYDLVLYIDCIAATGGTILEARRLLRERCGIGRDLAALVCSSEPAVLALREEGVGVVGFSLDEDLKGNVVTPDFGELDAGDLFSRAGARRTEACS
jgi:uracil phosphoribosyltransferase